MDEGIYAYRYGQHFSGMKRPFEQMTRPDAPFIAVLYAANVSLAKPVYGFFCIMLSWTTLLSSSRRALLWQRP